MGTSSELALNGHSPPKVSVTSFKLCRQVIVDVTSRCKPQSGDLESLDLRDSRCQSYGAALRVSRE